MRLDTEGIIGHLLLSLTSKDRELAVLRNPTLAAAMGCTCGSALAFERLRNANVLADLIEAAGGEITFTPKPDGYFSGKRIRQAVSEEGAVTFTLEAVPAEEAVSEEPAPEDQAPVLAAVSDAEPDARTSEEFLSDLREGRV